MDEKNGVGEQESGVWRLCFAGRLGDVDTGCKLGRCVVVTQQGGCISRSEAPKMTGGADTLLIQTSVTHPSPLATVGRWD